MASSADVVIVAHDSGPLLLDSVASAVAEAGEASVWVIDAESADGSIEPVRERWPGVNVLTVPNRGFSASNNRGIEATSDAYVLLLNPDAMLQPGALGVMVRALETEPAAAIAGPAVRNPDGSVQAGSFGRFPTLAVRITQALGRTRRRLAGRPHTPELPPQRTGVDWVTGAAMLVRRAAIADAGAMDEGFFLYYEDIEWCHRMRDHGWSVLLEPEASVVHHLGKSGAGARASRAYRESFERYCRLYGLWGLRLAGRIGVALRGGE